VSDFFTIKETKKGLAAVCGSGKISKGLEKLLLSAYLHLSRVKELESQLKAANDFATTLTGTHPDDIHKSRDERIKVLEARLKETHKCRFCDHWMGLEDMVQFSHTDETGMEVGLRQEKTNV
jgi:hypothetical protein